MRSARWLCTIVLGAGVLGAAAPARAQKAEDTLRIVWWDQLLNVNPYYNQLRSGLVVAHQAFDGLVARDPETFAIRPLLATAWKYVDDTTLELELRKGVKFGDGSAFSADDVVYTIDSILADNHLAVPDNYVWLAGAEKIDDYKVRIKLKHVFPAATEYLAMVLPILPKAYRERVGADAYDKQPLGAGPYRITHIEGTTRIDLERFEDYYAASPKGKPAIRWLRIHEAPDVATAQNEMIDNQADWTWNVPPDVADKLGAMPGMQSTHAETMRVNYLMFDAAGRTGADNPMTRQKVRQAIAYAIDRNAMAKNLMQGGSRVPEAPCYPSQFGCDGAAAVRYPYDPARAKALLTEAGYPNGFSTEVVSFLLPPFEGAVQEYLRAVGIDAKVTHLQAEAAVRRNLAGTAPLYLANWGSYSINDVSAFLPELFSGQPEGFSGADDTRDAALKKLVDAGGTSTNPDERRKNYSAAIKLATEQMYVLPIMTSVQTYVARKEVNFRAYPDELPRFYLATWK
jgi:peptide/nickel transport system substrate-binding protein